MSRHAAPQPPTSPVRYGSRYGLEPSDDGHPRCPVCASRVPARRARYCSDACKQRAYRLRQVTPAAMDDAGLAAELKRRGELVAHTVYECPECSERFVGARRCPDCHRFCRALGLGGPCPHCDQPVLLAELLNREELP